MNDIKDFIEDRFNELQLAPGMWGNPDMIESVCWGWLDTYVFFRTGQKNTAKIIVEGISRTKMRLYPNASINTGFASTVFEFERDPARVEARVATAYFEVFRFIKGKLDNE